MKILLEISYDGSAYHGFQVQKELPTVQSVLQKSLEEMFSENILLSGCSRTDAKVHAKQFFCTAEGNFENTVPCEAIPIVSQRYLPEDISVKSARIVPDSFHVRYDVLYKEYRYIINNSKVRDPFLSKRSFHCPTKLDEKIMDKAAQCFVGTHDFASYMAQGSAITDTQRTVKYCNVERNGDLVIIRIAADGFLYNMVRIISGTLVDVSKGKIKIEDIDGITKAKERKYAGETLPPDGLYLYKVVYREGAFD